MLLVPLGLEERPFRRVPVVTLGLILANALAFVVAVAAQSARANDAEVLRGLVESALEERPYLLVNERLALALGRRREEATRGARIAGAAPAAAPAPLPHQREQDEFDALTEDYLAAVARLPWHRLGFIPAQPTLLTLLTSMFMHAGWLHLLGNMVFLYASGPYVEEAYGRVVFAAAYLLAGAAAAVGQTRMDPGSAVPLVGASGAIAGVMGIVLVRLTTSRIRFLFLPIVFLPNLRIMLSLPALLVLPLWLLEQLAYASRTPAGAGGVAWWAHVWGFAAGAVLAALVKAVGLEERWLGRSAQADEGGRALENAAAARASGDFEKAHQELRRARATDPEDSGAWREAYELALAEQDAVESARAMGRLLDILPRTGEAAAALDLVDDGRWEEVPDPPARLFFSVASFLERHGRADRALRIYDQAIGAAPGDVLSLRALVRKGGLLAKQGDTEAARRTLELARSHPAADDEWRATIARAVASLGRAGD